MTMCAPVVHPRGQWSGQRGSVRRAFEPEGAEERLRVDRHLPRRVRPVLAEPGIADLCHAGRIEVAERLLAADGDADVAWNADLQLAEREIGDDRHVFGHGIAEVELHGAGATVDLDLAH